ncbi:MAG: TetR family transcriptional regulator [Lachnospiraceae bacterium]|nr:TetR family transcriptional regulator [Lachnospiraceae bacterium]
MPTAFTTEQQEEIRETLFHAGIRLSKKVGVQRMTVSKLVAAAGIAKGSFYSFLNQRKHLYWHFANMPVKRHR